MNNTYFTGRAPRVVLKVKNFFLYSPPPITLSAAPSLGSRSPLALGRASHKPELVYLLSTYLFGEDFPR